MDGWKIPFQACFISKLCKSLGWIPQGSRSLGLALTLLDPTCSWAKKQLAISNTIYGHDMTRKKYQQ